LFVRIASFREHVDYFREVVLKTRASAFVYTRKLEKYQYPPEHPFTTMRAERTRKIVESLGLLSGTGRSEIEPKPAERIILKKFHSARYLHALKTVSKGRWSAEALGMGLGTQDCPIFRGLYDYAVLACGGTLTGAELVLSGAADIAFNPSGGFHHAAPERASGFCYINDMALACIILAEAGKKVLYIDVDVHYGDGVAKAFYDRSDIMTISLHENPKVLFPGTGFEDEIGEGAGKGYCVNVPLPVGTYDDVYMKAFDAIARPLIGAFNPDVVVLQLGADALAGDPLAHLYLTNNIYADIINYLLTLNKPILATGGGGYNIENTVRAWALAWGVLASGGGSEDVDWQQELRDITLTVSEQQRSSVAPVAQATIEAVKKKVFPLHGL
jgi:acetoin utilization protein AcuC